MIPKLEVKRVSSSYHTLAGETLALSDISFSVQPGEFLAIVGPSGCGKSTLLSLLCGLSKPESGEVLLDGVPLGENASIGCMFQQDCLFPWRTIYANIALGLQIKKRLDANSRERIYSLMESYGLKGFEHAKPSELSGGMRQRAALIRTLVLDPDLLLLDEPFSALDYQTRLSVCDDISSIIRKENKTAILVTHDLSEAIATADRVLILTPRPGRVKAIVPIVFEDADTPLARRNSRAFSQYFNQVWKELKVDE